MLLSGAPTKTTVPFANSGAKNTIPVAASATPGLASYTTGFPALTMTPLSAGGIPPAGQDFNGILNAISQAVQYYSAGATFVYDSTFSSAVGGYPKGAILQNTTGTGLWYNTVDSNTVNPDTVGTGWLSLNPNGSATQNFNVAPATLAAHAMQLQQKGLRNLLAAGTAGTSSFTVPTGVFSLFYKLWGGGGGAGGGATGAQSGNSAGTGAYAEGWLAVTPGQVIPYVIGSQGNGGAVGLGGANGSSSTLNTTIVCGGGTAGAGGGTGGGVGGTATGGDLNIQGGNGSGPALVNSAGTLWYGPPGATAPGGSAIAIGYGTGAGSAGRFPGGGGSGGAGGSAGAFQGGAGSVGGLFLWG